MLCSIMLGLDEKLGLHDAGRNEKLTFTLTSFSERTVIQVFGDRPLLVVYNLS